MSNQENSKMNKPGTLRAIFILNALLVIAGFVFYFVFSSRAASGASTLGIDPTVLLYMALIYTGMFAVIVGSILKKSSWIMRIALLVTLVCSIFIVFAPIGLLISVVSLILSFLPSVRRYFED